MYNTPTYDSYNLCSRALFKQIIIAIKNHFFFFFLFQTKLMAAYLYEVSKIIR